MHGHRVSELWARGSKLMQDGSAPFCCIDAAWRLWEVQWSSESAPGGPGGAFGGICSSSWRALGCSSSIKPTPDQPPQWTLCFESQMSAEWTAIFTTLTEQ